MVKSSSSRSASGQRLGKAPHDRHLTVPQHCLSAFHPEGTARPTAAAGGAWGSCPSSPVSLAPSPPGSPPRAAADASDQAIGLPASSAAVAVEAMEEDLCQGSGTASVCRSGGLVLSLRRRPPTAATAEEVGGALPVPGLGLPPQLALDHFLSAASPAVLLVLGALLLQDPRLIFLRDSAPSFKLPEGLPEGGALRQSSRVNRDLLPRDAQGAVADLGVQSDAGVAVLRLLQGLGVWIGVQSERVCDRAVRGVRKRKSSQPSATGSPILSRCLSSLGSSSSPTAIAV
eukprot:CAMPEP_0115571678 /NCGR_PEP_ID=MMETSP0272-20121206/71_1 /TAXON_ID=71861 /ORGANISM="Scrippsiella trochoidea, Strain CCMP3099" /LENGTH=286 /DNA_ID=CAMNT_0003006247 /DNA_START=165 /DNA_END=1023 /DNA_ORIENTATION=-